VVITFCVGFGGDCIGALLGAMSILTPQLSRSTLTPSTIEGSVLKLGPCQIGTDLVCECLLTSTAFQMGTDPPAPLAQARYYYCTHPPTKKAKTEKSIILAIPLSTSVTMLLSVTLKGNER